MLAKHANVKLINRYLYYDLSEVNIYTVGMNILFLYTEIYFQ